MLQLDGSYFCACVRILHVFSILELHWFGWVQMQGGFMPNLVIVGLIRAVGSLYIVSS